MKKLILTPFLFVLLFGLATGNALAFSVGDPTMYGTFLGIFDGNDTEWIKDPSIVEQKILTATGDSVDLSYYNKYEDGGLDADSNTLVIDSTDDWYSGTWNTGSSGNLIQAYSVKGATNFSLWYLPIAAASGLWTTEGLDTGNSKTRELTDSEVKPPQLSHYTGFSGASVPVPEPATVLLLGAGLLGLAGVGRKTLKK